MDERSHELFAETLLKVAGKSDTSPKWGIAPDIDTGFFHRWYRHRISTLPKLYVEFRRSSAPDSTISLQDRIRLWWLSSKNISFIITRADLDAISLCVVSHLYLDIFNGWVFPFGIWNPVYPKNTVINGVLEDIDKPKLLVKELRRLSFGGDFAKQFYEESEQIMKGAIKKDCSAEQLIDSFVYVLSSYASGKTKNVYENAINNIEKFTGSNKYSLCTNDVDLSFKNHQFETEYARLINKAVEA